MSDQTLPTAAELRSDMRDEVAALRSRLKEAEAELFTARARLRDGDAKNALARLDAFLVGSTRGTPADSNGGGR